MHKSIVPAILLATASLSYAGSGRRFEPRHAVGKSLPGAAALVALCSDSAGAPWTSIGLTQRPPWVSVCAERRLRLMAALPGMEKDIQGDVDKYFGAKGPGLAVGLVLDDGLYYSQGFGFRDAQKAHAPDEITVFRAGSLSKVITGTGLLTLIDDPARHMSLDDPADDPKYLPELEFVCPASPNWQSCARGANHLGIKLKHLVSHTSGLADVMEQTNAGVGAWLGDLKKSYLLFAPGQYSSYSGVAVEGVGLIEQRVSGALSYPQFIEKHLFAPLGMTHSSMDPTQSPANLVAQRWRFNLPAPYTSWSFTADGSMLAGDDQAMILPAGGLATDVWDLARFMRMWLSGVAPSVNGHPLLKTSTIQSADLPQITAGAAPPPGCGNKNDPNNFYYSGCGKANGFGVNWYVGNKPYIMHNGDEPGYSGSETMIDQPAKMAATGLVSTEPYPNGPSGQQPPGLDGGFIDTVVWTHLMNEGLAADAKTTWQGEPLAEGTARLLWLSGAKPRMNARLLDQFSAGMQRQNHLAAGNVETFIQRVFGDAARCSTFRVRSVSGPREASLRLQCRKGASNAEESFDVTLSVDDDGRIAALKNAGVTSELY